MAVIDDLKQAVIDLTTAVTAGIAQINSELATIEGGGDSAAIEDAVASIKTETQAINDAVTAAQTALGTPKAP